MDGGRSEIKYIVPLHREELIRAWLDHLCVPDPKHPSGTVSSIYFDTPRLSLFEGKRSSDYIKVKIRLRWYPGAGGARAPAWLEAKVKEGRLVRKARVKLMLPRDGLHSLPFPASLVEDLQARAAELAGSPLGLLRPLCLVSYRRRRYIDSRSGSRIALDGGIRAFPAGDHFFPGIAAVEAGVSVLEVKGTAAGDGHFAHLFPTKALSSLPTSFSKYAWGVEALRRGSAEGAFHFGTAGRGRD